MPDAKKILYVDLDNTLVDFQTGIDRTDPDVRARYEGNYDEIPGIFGKMDPLPGAVEAYTSLAAHFDTYILSTAPWRNPSAWHDKVLWVQQHFGFEEDAVAYKRLILSHHKNLNRGHYLVDDRPHNGADRFEGVDSDGGWIQFGGKDHDGYGQPVVKCADWAAVTAYLLDRV